MSYHKHDKGAHTVSCQKRQVGSCSRAFVALTLIFLRLQDADLEAFPFRWHLASGALVDPPHAACNRGVLACLSNVV